MPSLDSINSKNGAKRRYPEKAPAKNTNKKTQPEPVFSDFVTNPKLLEAHEKFVTNIHTDFDNIKNFIRAPKLKFDSKRLKSNFSPNRLKFKFNLERFLISLIVLLSGYLIFTWVTSVKASTNDLMQKAQKNIDQSYSYLEKGELDNSLKYADQANQNIKQIKLLVQSVGQDISYFQTLPFNQSELTTDESLLDASYSILNALNQVNSKFATLLPKEELGVDYTKNSNKIMLNISDSQKVILSLITANKNNLIKSKNTLEKAQKTASGQNQEKISKVISLINSTTNKLSLVEELANEDLSWISGADGSERRILIIFQNNDELRGGSGGSLGSFGVANFKDGNLQGIDFGQNIFTIDQAFESTGQYVTPPDELKFLRQSKTWTMKDSGWAVDGSDALKNIMSFYTKETGTKVDGCIMVDTSAIASLVGATGSIAMPEYNTTITADNLRSTLEYETHDGYWQQSGSTQENQPKKIIGDMMPIFMNQLLSGFGNKEMFPKIASSFSNSLKQKDIIFYFDKSDFQSRIDQVNYSGTIAQSLGDYLSIYNSNVGGAKSSLNINETLEVSAIINNDGSIDNNLKISRQHLGSGNPPDGTNINFSRLLVTQNSQVTKFESVSGNFDQFFTQGLKNNSQYWKDSVNGKDEINFWMNTEPGKTSDLKLQYRSGYTVKTTNDFVYSITFQRQPGANPDKINLSLTFPSGFTPTNVTSFDPSSRSLMLPITLDQDQTIKIKFHKNYSQ